MATLHLVRHGQASFGAEHYDELSGLGVRQCQLLGEWWQARGLVPGRIISGPMHRHKQSMEAFFHGFGRELEHDTLPDLAEFDHENVLEVYWPLFGDKVALAKYMAETSRPRQAFHQIFVDAVARWHSGNHDSDYNESWLTFRERVRDGFDALRAQGGDAVVFTSGGVISVMIQAILGFSDAKSFAINAITLNSSVSRVLYRPGESSLHSFNNTAHLDIHNDAALLTYR